MKLTWTETEVVQSLGRLKQLTVIYTVFEKFLITVIVTEEIQHIN